MTTDSEDSIHQPHDVAASDDAATGQPTPEDGALPTTTELGDAESAAPTEAPAEPAVEPPADAAVAEQPTATPSGTPEVETPEAAAPRAEAPTSEASPTGPTFADFGLADPVARAVSDTGYETPSAIQAETIPLIMAGRDVVGLAQTGTGKTAAFALPVLSLIDPSVRSPQALVLAPTRELAQQVPATPVQTSTDQFPPV